MTGRYWLLVAACLTQLGCQAVVPFNPLETNSANQLADFAYVQADQLHLVDRDGTLVDTVQSASAPLAVVNYAGDQVVYVQAVTDKFQLMQYDVATTQTTAIMPLVTKPTTMSFSAEDASLLLITDGQLYTYLFPQQRSLRVHEGVTAAYFLPSGKSIVYLTTAGATLQRDLTVSGELTAATTVTELPFTLLPETHLLLAPQFDQAILLSTQTGELSLVLPDGTAEVLAEEVTAAGWSNTGTGVYYIGVEMIPKLLTL